MPNIHGSPYFSVVLFSRNDDHGSRMFRRMKLCIDTFLSQLERFRIPSELILVDWNPPADRPLLKDACSWPADLKFCDVRVIVIPPEIHRRYEHSNRFPMHTKVAPNVGIRRSRGEFVLSTAVDCLLSDPLMEFISRRELCEGVMYRLDRCDVNREILSLPFDDPAIWLSYCEKNIVDLHGLSPLKYLYKRRPVLHDKAPGDFILLSRRIWHAFQGYPEIDFLGTGSDNIVIYQAYLFGARQKILKRPMRLYHIDHDSRWRSPSYLKLRKRLIRMHLPYSVVDVLSRAGSAFSSSQSPVEKAGVKIFGSAETKEVISNMLSGKRPPIYNDDRWGLGDLTLEEYSVA